MYSFENDSFFTDLAASDEQPVAKKTDNDSEDPDEEIDGEDFGGKSAKKMKEEAKKKKEDEPVDYYKGDEKPLTEEEKRD